MVARNNFRKTALFKDYVNAVFDCQLAKAVAATGADDRTRLLAELQDISPVSEGRQKTARYATALFGDDADANKILFAVDDADAVKMLVEWVLASGMF